jgi:hypothetical protein
LRYELLKFTLALPLRDLPLMLNIGHRIRSLDFPSATSRA